MAAERTRTISRHYLEYLKKRAQGTEYPQRNVAPVQAVMFDSVELSSSPEKEMIDHHWLTSYIAGLSDKEVTRKVKKYFQGYSTIDDAIVDKILMELL